MTQVFLKLLNMSLTAIPLVIAAAAFRLAFRRGPKWIRCLMWGLVALRLMIPFTFDSPVGVIPDAEPVKLTATEYGIIEYLMTNLGRVLSTTQIYEAVWNEPSYSTEKTVTVHIRRIREKIEINTKEPKYMKVVWGIGYKIEKI